MDNIILGTSLACTVGVAAAFRADLRALRARERAMRQGSSLAGDRMVMSSGLSSQTSEPRSHRVRVGPDRGGPACRAARAFSAHQVP